jgi:hypothetical protein
MKSNVLQRQKENEGIKKKGEFLGHELGLHQRFPVRIYTFLIVTLITRFVLDKRQD